MNKKHILVDLDKYMFSIKNIDFIENTKKRIGIIDNFAKKTKISNSKEQNKYNTLTTTSKVKKIHPIFEDKLFWCFFIMLKGEDEYNYSHKSNFKIEKDIKIQSIEKMKEYSPQLKLHKIKYINIENEMLNEKCISIQGLYALCLIYDISVIYVKGKTFYEINNNNTDIKYIIEKKGIDNICINIDVESDAVMQIRSNLYRIENIIKPLKSISSYKVDELKAICKKLNIELLDSVGKNKKKYILYEEVVKKL